VISPLLANSYLHWFEVLFHRADGPANWAKASIVRYADDFVVLAYYQGERLRKWIESTLEDRFGLTINREKTKVVKLNEVGGEPLEFLGFSVRYERSIWGTTSYLRIGASRNTMARFRDRLRELTSTRYCFMPTHAVVSVVNRYLRGWSRYFGYGHPRRAFDEANYHTQLRMVSHLKRRSQRGNRSSQSRSYYTHLYDHLGLLRLCVNR
jgi:RNA-directed DNA polymerase